MVKWSVGVLIAVVLFVGTFPERPGLTAQARAATGASFTLAVLRRDGIVIPFAIYDAGRWTNRWPAPGRREDIPILVAESPRRWWVQGHPIDTWTAWPMRGEGRVVHVKSPVNLTAECQRHVGLQTDYVSAEPLDSPKIQPYPKDGLATSGNVVIQKVDLLDAASPDWTAIAAEVAAKVTAAEPALLKEAELRRAVSDRQRAGTLFSLEVLFRSPGRMAGTSVLYFEGVKRYAPQATLAGGLMTYAVGFARIGPSGKPRIDVSATLSDRRREGLVYTLVLGSFRVEGRLFWVVQRSGWGYERFDVLELGDDDIRTVFKAEGGSCQ